MKAIPRCAIDRHLSPVVCAADVLPGVFRPRVVAELAWTWHCVKGPDELAAADIVGANVAGRRHVPFTRSAADDDQVLEYLTGSLRLYAPDGFRVASVDADPQVDGAVDAERRDRFPGLRVQLLQQAVHREDEALVAAVAAFPVHHAAVAHAVHVLADPQLAPCFRVDRDDRAIAAAAINHAARDNRSAHGLAVRVAPRDLQLIDVGLVDLSRREVA